MPENKKLFSKLEYAGEIVRTPGDYLQIVAQNHGADKVDAYIGQEFEYGAAIKRDGSVISKVHVTLTNNTPKKGLPEYVLGETSSEAENSSYLIYLSVYVPGNSRLLECSYDGSADNPEIGQEKYKVVHSHYANITAGEKRDFAFNYVNKSSSGLSSGNAEYRLAWQIQPTIIDPQVKINIAYPNGYRVTDSSNNIKQIKQGLIVEQILSSDLLFTTSLTNEKAKGAKVSKQTK